MIIHVVQDQDIIPIVRIYPCINLTVIATILSGYDRRYCKTKRLAPGKKREREVKKYLHYNTYCLAPRTEFHGYMQSPTQSPSGTDKR
jgi:hypothetical protein